MRVTDYESFMKDEETRTFGSSTMEYKYFSIKPGETATVRFMVDSVADFDLEVIHKVKLSDGKTKSISCIGDGCPLCAAGLKQTKRIYIPLLKYSADGTVEPCVWDRDKEYAVKLRNYINDYGPLSEILCNVTREGTGLDTTYIISPNVHTRDAENYPRVEFPNVEPSKYCLSVKTAEEMEAFVATGEFPAREYTRQNNTTVGAPTEDVPFENSVVVEQPTSAPVNTFNNQIGGRPRRY